MSEGEDAVGDAAGKGRRFDGESLPLAPGPCSPGSCCPAGRCPAARRPSPAGPWPPPAAAAVGDEVEAMAGGGLLGGEFGGGRGEEGRGGDARAGERRSASLAPGPCSWPSGELRPGEGESPAPCTLYPERRPGEGESTIAAAMYPVP